MSNKIVGYLIQIAACCFISLSILEELSIHSLVKEFIVLRSNMLQHTLTDANSPEKNIENSSTLIINTIYNLYLCFTSKKIKIMYFANHNSLLSPTLNYYHLDYDQYNIGLIHAKIKENLKEGRSVLSLVDLDYSLQFGLKYIPNSIRDFKYKTKHYLFATLFVLQSVNLI